MHFYSMLLYIGKNFFLGFTIHSLRENGVAGFFAIQTDGSEQTNPLLEELRNRVNGALSATGMPGPRF